MLLTPLPSKDELSKLKELNIDEHIFVWELRDLGDNMKNGCPKVFNLVYEISQFQKNNIEDLVVK